MWYTCDRIICEPPYDYVVLVIRSGFRVFVRVAFIIELNLLLL